MSGKRGSQQLDVIYEDQEHRNDSDASSRFSYHETDDNFKSYASSPAQRRYQPKPSSRTSTDMKQKAMKDIAKMKLELESKRRPASISKFPF